MERMLITAELELPELILLNFPYSEPFEMEETFLKPLHHANSVLLLFSPVSAHWSDFLANIGFLEVGHGFSLLATYLTAMNTKIGFSLSLSYWRVHSYTEKIGNWSIFLFDDHS